MMPADQPTTDIICLVDDDAAVLQSISRLLTSDGFAVRAFDEPKSFLAHTLTNRVPLVVLDICMYDMDGFEAQGMVSALSPETKIIVITGAEDATTKQRVLDAGAVAFFTKPFDDDQFLNAVRGALATHPSE